MSLFEQVIPHITVIGVAAISSNNVLGDGQDLAIKDTRDLRLFKTLTMGKVLVMGRKTVDSLPRKLLGRVVVCLTNDKNYSSSKCDYVVNSLDELAMFCLEYTRRELFICGGGQVYSLFKGYYDRFYLTHYRAEAEGQTVFDMSIVKDYTVSYSRKAVWSKGGMVKYELKREVYNEISNHNVQLQSN